VKERLTTIDFLTPVQELIHRVEDRMRTQADGHSSELSAALEHLLASGGKRVRTAMTLLSGGMLGGEPERLITLAAAVELLHTATLVHDDLIDGALLRRGNPTINAQWSPAATVLTGDFIFARAAKLAAETDSVMVVHKFAETLSIIVNGEINQLFERRKLSSREDYYRRIHAKTASMFELATGAAALLSSAPPAVVEAMYRYGYQVGMAFQIIDDVLDFTGEQSTIGKPVASDLRQGLITLPALCYMEVHPDDPDMKAFLNGSNHYSEERLLRLVGSIRKSGAIQSAIEEAKQYVDRGLAMLEGMPDNPERRSLEDLALYVVRRRR
jgi:geranylgeranyl pyrophosphate synthase